MKNSASSMKKSLDSYFDAWRKQDSELLCELFTNDGVYRVKPFDIEVYVGKDEIRKYWKANPVTKQIRPQPKLLNSAFGENICFAEWENTFTTLEGKLKVTRGMLILEFSDGLIKELRENYLSQEIAS
jgi:ketosteroid isomerase-like protein